VRYEHTPRPLIEEHYHIRMLFEAQEKNAADRQYHRDREKDKQERNDLIRDTKVKDIKEFFCETCKEDFQSETIKEVEIDWSNPSQYIAFYKTKCLKGHWCQRLITDRFSDRYWFKSRRVARDRGRHALDILQPWETNYQLIYGRKNAHLK